MSVRETGVANLQVSHCDITVDTAARSPWKYHWFHVMQFVVLETVPVPLTLGQSSPDGDPS
jgi:hypothetical protein